MKKKIMAALLAGVMMLQQPVSGWCAQNTDSAQQSETDEVTLDTGTSNNAVTGERTILEHIYLESVDLSGMTKEEAQEAVQSRVDEITGYQIILHMDDMSNGVTAKELGVTGDNDGTIRQAMDVGQVGNVIRRYKVKKALEKGKICRGRYENYLQIYQELKDKKKY